MKKLRMLIIGSAAAAIAVLGIIFHTILGAEPVATRYLGALQRGDHQGARACLAAALRQELPDARLGSVLPLPEETGLRGSRWSGHKAGSGRAEVTGSITTAEGDRIPVKISMLREGLFWRISGALRLEAEEAKPKGMLAGLEAIGEEPNEILPDEMDQVKMVQRAMLDFAVSVRKKSMSHFRETLLAVRQKQYSTARLNEVFRVFFEMKEDLRAIARTQPVIEEPLPPDESGVIVLKGYFPSEPKRVNFVQRYLNVNDRWQLISFAVVVHEPTLAELSVQSSGSHIVSAF